MCGGVQGRVGGGVWFPHGICMRGVCVRGRWLLFSRRTYGCRCVGNSRCMRVCLFIVRSGCSVVGGVLFSVGVEVCGGR